jgi:hypothetical protein
LDGIVIKAVVENLETLASVGKVVVIHEVVVSLVVDVEDVVLVAKRLEDGDKVLTVVDAL